MQVDPYRGHHSLRTNVVFVGEGVSNTMLMGIDVIYRLVTIFPILPIIFNEKRWIKLNMGGIHEERFKRLMYQQGASIR
jgi:hypothetical protein